jgi:hypothetical protein
MQHAKVYLQGKDEPVPMSLRMMEVFRRDDSEGKFVHRHADMPKSDASPRFGRLAGSSTVIELRVPIRASAIRREGRWLDPHPGRCRHAPAIQPPVLRFESRI